MAEKVDKLLCIKHAATWPDDLSSEEVVSYYNTWMESEDLNYEDIKNIGYHGPSVLAECMKPHLDKMTSLNRILDIGAGSGFLAMELRPLIGDKVVMDALEPSEKMRQAARKKNLYSEFFSDFVNGLNSTSIASETYDCVCSTGCFVPSHIPAEGTQEMMRLTKIGGIVAFSMRSAYVNTHPGYKGKFMVILDKMIDDGIAEKLEMTHDVPYFGNHKGLVVIFKKIGHI